MVYVNLNIYEDEVYLSICPECDNDTIAVDILDIYYGEGYECICNCCGHVYGVLSDTEE